MFEPRHLGCYHLIYHPMNDQKPSLIPDGRKRRKLTVSPIVLGCPFRAKLFAFDHRGRCPVYDGIAFQAG